MRGHEQDRTGLHGPADPLADGELLALVGQETQRLRVGVEHGADRFRHARCLRRGKRIGDRVREKTVHALQVSGHQIVGEIRVGSLPASLEFDAHFDEQRARRHRPEGFGRTPVRRDQRGGRGCEFRVG